MEAKLKPKAGEKYHMLTCLGEDTEKGKPFYLFKCECGNVKSIRYFPVVKGSTVSCGCYARKIIAEHMPIKHGGRGTRLYRIWKNMRTRCNNPNSPSYQYYGGKGIKICSEWDDFAAFSEWAYSNGYSEELTIDRKDFTKGYSPDNCRWVTRKEQSNNKTNNVFITQSGETHTMAEWCEIYGLPYGTIKSRWKRHKSTDGLFAPIEKGAALNG